MDENNLTLGFCRACLIKYKDPLDLTYYSEKNRRLFVYATGLQVKHNDNFSFQLCKNCFSNMKIASKFKKLCRTSDKMFKTFMDLKKESSNLDFCNYIKNADTSYMYRMPTFYDTSPSKHTADNDKDETASTSTSIRNFMTDILREEDIPATEAKIISQVIAEEADILEDSLDSHWLDDDDITVNDDILDFSFSPFSTPKVESNERFTNFPIALHGNEETNTNKYQFDTNVKTDIINMAFDGPRTNINANSFIIDSTEIKNIETISNQSPMKTLHINDNQYQGTPNKCVIDKNLAMALKNDSLQISLDDLIKTPRADYKDIFDKGKDHNQSTPDYIKNLDKPISIDFDKYQYSHFDPDVLLQGLDKKAPQTKENSFDYSKTNKEEKPRDEQKQTKIDNNNEEEQTKDNKENNEVPENKVATENSFDFENCYCKICKLKFKALNGLKCHAKRIHDYYLTRAQRVRQLMICDYCDKQMYTEKGNFLRHIKSHMNTKKNKKLYKCEICSSVFEKASHLTMHSYHHMPPGKRDKIWEDRRKFVCAKCGAKSSTAATLRLHMLRHENKYKYECPVCNKLFVRNHEVNVHMRNHTGATPYECKTCHKAFKRRDQLSRHLVTHYYNFKCDRCKSCFEYETDYHKHITRKRKCKQSIKEKKTCDEKKMVKGKQKKPELDVLTKDESDNQDVYLLYVK